MSDVQGCASCSIAIDCENVSADHKPPCAKPTAEVVGKEFVANAVKLMESTKQKAQSALDKAAVTVVQGSEQFGTAAGNQLKVPYQTAKGFFKGLIKGLEKPL